MSKNSPLPKEYYPTPDAIIDDMMSYIDFTRVERALEPSAGRGHIVKKLNNMGITTDMIEIDETFRNELELLPNNLLKAKDFLAFNAYLTSYDLIIMNPPFSNGVYHLLHAIETVSKNGQICCILNASNLENAYSNIRKLLQLKLEMYNATVVNIKNGFSNSERHTDVETVLIYIDLNKTCNTQNDINLNVSHSDNSQEIYTGIQNVKFDLTKNDWVSLVVEEYDKECEIGIELIHKFNSQVHTINVSQYFKRDNVEALKLKELDFLKETRLSFWKLVLNRPEITEKLTSELRSEYFEYLTNLNDVEFTVSNINEVILDVLQNFQNNIKKEICRLFDRITHDVSLDNRTNIHYFNGWKTNSAYKLKTKIIYYIGSGYSFIDFNANCGEYLRFIRDFDKIINYVVQLTHLDTPTTLYDNKVFIGEVDYRDYYTVELKKKGTIHIYFKYQEIVDKFNIIACQEKQWLPSDYGTKSYTDMTEEEKTFMDISEYNRYAQRYSSLKA